MKLTKVSYKTKEYELVSINFETETVELKTPAGPYMTSIWSVGFYNGLPLKFNTGHIAPEPAGNKKA